LLKMCHLPSAFNMLTAPVAETTARQPAEQVKKKPDTAVVSPKPEVKTAEELPVLSEQPLTYDKVTPTEPEPPKKEAESVVVEKQKTFVPNSHTPSTSVKIPSLKELGTTAATSLEEEDPYIKGDAMEAFTIDDFLKHWNDYAAKIKKDGNMSLFTVFTANAPVMLEPYQFEVVVGNKSQETLFRDEKPDILNYLRTSLKNFRIEVQTRVDEIKASKKPYTNTEKFQHMASKNPQLAELKRRFNLETDY
ncbi:MAG: DNA polymerase III subunit gamma/tau, partial [Mucilaginibacter sp.]